METTPAFAAVIFDLDGTLVATDQFWIPAARAATRRVFAERGITLEQPSGNEWMRLVGYPMRVGLRIVLPDLDDESMDALHIACVEEEEKELRKGRAALLPGCREMLQDLKQRGVRLGIASNCGKDYLVHMMEALGLQEWIEEARCLDTPGIRDKSDMVADLLLHFDTKSAVMVGDRAGDMAAGHASDLPCIAYTGAFGDPIEAMDADAEIEHLVDLVPLLESGKLVVRRV
ncbi:MAG: HAD superfamily hydrolase (TIGR01549 family) [Planctomycetota bacterium]|jgi:HAD superfamily hydrolase (TIGR01549 family)